MAVHFYNITREEFLSKKLIYKFMSIEHALDMLKNQTMWFANPVIWKDPFEKLFIENEYIFKDSNPKKFPWYGRVFCTCMTQTATSEAYWTTYAPEDIGISFAIKRDLLIQQLDDFSQRTGFHVFVGKVEYQKTSLITGKISNNPFIQPYLSPSGIGNEESKVRLLLIKRSSYRYEDEIRFFIVKPKKSNTKGITLKYQSANVDLIHTITLDPRLKENTFALLEDTFVNKYNFTPHTPKNKRVLKSNLYNPIGKRNLYI